MPPGTLVTVPLPVPALVTVNVRCTVVNVAVTACAAGTEPPITTRDSLRALRTVFGIYDSARTGQATEIPQ